MISNIVVSKVRIKILKLFFTDLEKEIHIRGIVRKIDEEINAVRRELKNLEKAKILVKEQRGNRHYYKILPECQIFSELLGLINKEFGLGRIILDNSDNLGQVQYAILTKSYIDNKHEGEYDVDLMLVGEIRMDFLAKLIKSAEEGLGREIRYTVLSEDDFIFRKKKRDSFTLNIINRRNILLLGNADTLLT
ncbi:MAG: winged helix-turn-helix domain-containing protein [bacterium]